MKPLQKAVFKSSISKLNHTGMDIVEPNYETSLGNVIIARDGEYLVFVDVQLCDGAFDHVDVKATLEKMEHIALAFLQDNDMSDSFVQVRFDVCQVLPVAKSQCLMRHTIAIGHEMVDRPNELKELLDELVDSGDITKDVAQRILSVA